MKFKTVFQEAQDEFVEKKSRFIGMAFPVESEEEVQLYLEDIRKQYWNASHNGVYAYSVGVRKEIQRFSDGGEPTHTAGLPILDILKSEAIHNTLIVVIRYFGGTLLGTGGLVRAYSKAAKLALTAAGVIEKESYIRNALTMEYTLLGKMQYGLLQDSYTIEDIQYTEAVTMRLLIPEDRQEIFEKRITELSEGRIQTQREECVLAAEYGGAWHYYEMPEAE